MLVLLPVTDLKSGRGVYGLCCKHMLKGGSVRQDQFTTLLAQLLLAKASGLALKAKPIPRI